MLAAIGAAVGLGSVWKFPYTVGVNGGGAFVLIYLIVSALITLPILISEFMLGRRGQASPPTTMERLAVEARSTPGWRWLGWLTVAAIYLILTYYSVIGGWVIAFGLEAAQGKFTNASGADISALFAALLADPWRVALWHGVFMAATVGIILKGVQDGIERFVKIMMPALFFMLVALIIYAAVVGDFARAIEFLFKPDFSEVTGQTILSAVGLSFFSIGTGMAIMMTYGSYLPRGGSLVRPSITIALSVPFAALATGLAIFPLVFANGQNPGEGPGLLFVTLPVAFGHMPFGVVFGSLFFVLVLFAALTSSIAAIEPIVAWLEEHKGVKRRTSAIGAGIVAWLLGLLTVFSFNIWQDVRLLGSFEKFSHMSIFELLDFLTSNVMLPLGNILICLFVGWVMSAKVLREELSGGSQLFFNYWRWTLRLFAPALITVILIMGIL